MTVAAPLAQKSPVTVPSTAMAADSVYHEHLPVSRSGHRVRAFLRTGLAGYRRISRDKHYDISGKADRVEEIRPDRNSQLRVTPIWT